jgi:hypothetical protein
MGYKFNQPSMKQTYFDIKKTRCVLKHKCPRTRPIPEVAVIVKTKIQKLEGQGHKVKNFDTNRKVLS